MLKENSLKVQLFAAEMRLDDACGLHARAQYILLCGYIVRLRNAIQRVQIVSSRVVQLILARAGKGLLHSGVRPQFLHQHHNLRQQNAFVCR